MGSILNQVNLFLCDLDEFSNILRKKKASIQNRGFDIKMDYKNVHHLRKRRKWL
jgi:hypothetical protein